MFKPILQPTFRCRECKRMLGQHVPSSYARLLMRAFDVEPPTRLLLCPGEDDQTEYYPPPPPCECRDTFGKPLHMGQLHKPDCKLREELPASPQTPPEAHNDS